MDFAIEICFLLSKSLDPTGLLLSDANAPPDFRSVMNVTPTSLRPKKGTLKTNQLRQHPLALWPERWYKSKTVENKCG